VAAASSPTDLAPLARIFILGYLQFNGLSRQNVQESEALFGSSLSSSREGTKRTQTRLESIILSPSLHYIRELEMLRQAGAEFAESKDSAQRLAR
jgi:hypothetical protein